MPTLQNTELASGIRRYGWGVHLVISPNRLYGWTSIRPYAKLGQIGEWLSAYIAEIEIWMDLVRLFRVRSLILLMKNYRNITHSLNYDLCLLNVQMVLLNLNAI